MKVLEPGLWPGYKQKKVTLETVCKKCGAKLLITEYDIHEI